MTLSTTILFLRKLIIFLVEIKLDLFKSHEHDDNIFLPSPYVNDTNYISFKEGRIL
jgi:hypothetical protein